MACTLTVSGAFGNYNRLLVRGTVQGDCDAITVRIEDPVGNLIVADVAYPAPREADPASPTVPRLWEAYLNIDAATLADKKANLPCQGPFRIVARCDDCDADTGVLTLVCRASLTAATARAAETCVERDGVLQRRVTIEATVNRAARLGPTVVRFKLF
ncbi:MAG TPA: hypothetical protein VNK91_06010, partial [Burkholderiaceae bacterium]|nr:hypothetical protein [Burkholderiaceae bacterium]